VQAVVVNALFAGSAVRAYILTACFGAAVAEFANPVFVLAAVLAVVTSLLAAAGVLVAGVAHFAVHLVVDGAIFTKAAIGAEFFIFGVAQMALWTNKFFVTLSAGVFVIAAPFFHKQTVATNFAE